MGNEAALKSMAKMIQVMLPYELYYSPKTCASETLLDIFDLLQAHTSKINEFEGFFNYILKNMDAKGESDKVDRLLMNIWAIINNRYPPYKLKQVDNELDEDEDDPELHPELFEDLGSDD